MLAEYPAVSAWLDRLAHQLLGESVVALRPYRREALRWRIHELLPQIGDAVSDGRENLKVEGHILAAIQAPRTIAPNCGGVERNQPAAHAVIEHIDV